MHKRFSSCFDQTNDIINVNIKVLFCSISLCFVSFCFFDIHLTIVLDVVLVGCNWIGKETFNFYSSIKQAWQPRSCSFLSNSGITMKLEEQLEEKYKHQSNVQPLFDALYLSFLSSIPNIVGSNPL